MNLLEEFLAQLGIFTDVDDYDIVYTKDTSEFVVVDNEEGDYGVIKYYDGESLLAVRIVSGGDIEETQFTPYGKQILSVHAQCWFERAIEKLSVIENKVE